MNKKMKQLIVEKFGVERLIAALPQRQIKNELQLKTVVEVAKAIGVPVATFRSKMAAGKIPFPEIRLRRRAYFSSEQADAIINRN